MKIFIFITILGVIFLCSTVTFSATIHVPGDSATIQAGINGAVNGDTVLVADGIYTGIGNNNIVFNGKHVLLKSENGLELTIIDCENNGIAFNIAPGHGSNLIIDGFTLTNGQYSNWAGGAMRSFGSSPTIKNCLFLKNVGAHGGAIYFNGNGTSPGPSPSIINCTFAKNVAAGNAGAIYIQYNEIAVNIENSIFYNCIGNTEPVMSQDAASVYLSCCDIFGNLSGDWIGSIAYQFGLNGNITSDPYFCDTVIDNYSLLSNSPCLPGNNSCGMLIGALGQGCMDMLSNVGIENEELENVVNNIPTFYWIYNDADPFPNDSFEIAVGTDSDWTYAEMWNPAPLESADTFVVYDGSTLIDGDRYYLRLKVRSNEEWSRWYGIIFRMNTKPSIPEPQYPLYDEVTNNTPILWVENSTDAEGDLITYDFSGFHDTDCVAPIIDLQGVVEGTDSTGGQIIDPLGENCIYWWSARAYDGYEYSDGSITQRIFIDGTPEPPTEFMAQFPPDTGGLPVCDMLTYFYWGKSYDGDPLDTVRYKLEISIDPLFNFVFGVDSIEDNQHTLTDSLQFGTHYWWKVTAFDKDGLTTQSSNIPDFWTWMLGDADGNHAVNILDITFLINYLYKGGSPPYPLVMGDVNGDCSVNILDITYLIAYLYKGGLEPQVGCELK